MTLNNFISHIKSKGISKPNRFRVRITLPVGLQNASTSRTLEIMCDTATLPGKILTTSPVTRHGITRKTPNQTLFENMSLSFKVDGTMNQRTIFDSWHNLVHDMDSFDFNYPNEYRTNVTVEQLNEHDIAIYGVNLHEVYPESVHSMELGQGINDSVHKVHVDLVFTKWTNIVYDAVEPEDDTIAGRLRDGVANRLPWLKNNKYLG